MAWDLADANQYYWCWLPEWRAGILDIRILSVVHGNSRAMPVPRRDGLNSSYIKRPIPFRCHAQPSGRFQIAELALRYGSSSYRCGRSSMSDLLVNILGWVTVFAWQSNIASVGYLATVQIQALVTLNYESYVYERWHGSMLFWAVVIVSTCVNVFGNKILPHLEIIAGILHVCLFFVFLVPFVYLSPRPTAATVFTDFENNSGWNNNVVSWCIGLLTVTFPFIGMTKIRYIVIAT